MTSLMICNSHHYLIGFTRPIRSRKIKWAGHNKRMKEEKGMGGFKGGNLKERTAWKA
jgi:hypothetical protein